MKDVKGNKDEKIAYLEYLFSPGWKYGNADVKFDGERVKFNGKSYFIISGFEFGEKLELMNENGEIEYESMQIDPFEWQWTNGMVWKTVI